MAKCELKKENVAEILSSYGIAADELLAFVECDLSHPETYGTSVMCALNDALCVIYEDNTFLMKKYSEIKSINAENYISSSAVILRTENEEFAISYFTLKQSSRIEWFMSIVQKLMSGQSPDTENISEYSKDDFSYINNGRKKLFMRVLSYVPKYRKQLIKMIIIIFLLTGINLLQPFVTGTILYDHVLNPEGMFAGRIAELVMVLIFIAAFSTFLGITQGRIGAEMSGNIIYDIKTEVFSSMQKLGMSFFSSKRTGNLLNRINSDALDIQYFLNDGLPNFIINAATICAVGLCLFITNPLLSAAVLIPLPIIALIIKKSVRVFKKLKWHSWRKSSSLNSLINDSLMGVRVVKAFGKEESESARFKSASKQLCDNRIREGIASAKVFPLLSWIMALGGMVVWGLGGAQVISGRLTFGQLMSFVGYLALLYNPVNFMVKTFDWWTSCMNSAQRIFEVIDRKSDIKEASEPVSLEKVAGKVELENVSFSYEPNRPVLKNVSFSVQPGEMVGLVGHSGAGKSTITNLITRLYDVNDGEVRIDGVNVKELSFDTLRNNIGMVLQETYLFSGSIAENIAYGKPGATMEEIIDSAKKAYAHSFIANLPDGYDTRIGKGGMELSGGEKQRISIARAILMDPAILIFDEATASLDTKTEQQIQKAMQLLVKNRTTIAIAHRFSTLKNASRLIVIENGRVAEEGTHEELFNKEDGIYASMAKKQLDSLNFNKSNVP